MKKSSFVAMLLGTIGGIFSELEKGDMHYGKIKTGSSK